MPDHPSLLAGASISTLALALALYPLHLEQARRVQRFVELSRLLQHYDWDRAGGLGREQWDALCLDVRCGGGVAGMLAARLPGAAKLGAVQGAEIFSQAVARGLAWGSGRGRGRGRGKANGKGKSQSNQKPEADADADDKDKDKGKAKDKGKDKDMDDESEPEPELHEYGLLDLALLRWAWARVEELCC